MLLPLGEQEPLSKPTTRRTKDCRLITTPTRPFHLRGTLRSLDVLRRLLSRISRRRRRSTMRTIAKPPRLGRTSGGTVDSLSRNTEVTVRRMIKRILLAAIPAAMIAVTQRLRAWAAECTSWGNDLADIQF